MAASLPALLLALLPQGPTPAEGQPFPLQEYPQIGKDGLHSLAEYRGRKVLLVQFASW